MNTYKIKANVWIYPGDTAWHFVTVPKKQSKNIDVRYGKMKRGWGSLPVHVSIGTITWDTSIFPDKKSGTYLLPLKAHIRRQTGLESGDSVTYTLTIRVE